MTLLMISSSGHLVVFMRHTFVRRILFAHICLIFRYIGLIANYSLDDHFCVMIIAVLLHCDDNFLSNVHWYHNCIFILLLLLLLLLLMLYDLISGSIAVGDIVNTAS